MTTLISKEPRLRVPHHPAHLPEPAKIPWWRKFVSKFL